MERSKASMEAIAKSKEDKTKLKTAVRMTDLVAKSKGTHVTPHALVSKLKVLAPEAVETLADLMANSKTDSVRLKAATEILGFSGVSRETVLTVKTDTRDMTEKEINERLGALMGDALTHVAEAEYDEIEETT